MKNPMELSDNNKADKKEAKSNQEEKINTGKLAELIRLVTDLLSPAADNQDMKTYQANYNLVSSLPDNKIIDFINNFDTRTVIADPHFYSALIKKAEDKKLIRSYF